MPWRKYKIISLRCHFYSLMRVVCTGTVGNERNVLMTFLLLWLFCTVDGCKNEVNAWIIELAVY